ncbi:hypothetical protein [Terasakiella sp. SH-1]|uniref:hypothetical protein n=1 Tax=Terasakiella sp. SH-1 TaxID=2560057 RepID=UPI0010741185|nr:hypothetical protein [Terasakiella sp. SH-1]
MSTDKHLIAEIKRELDWAAEEVRRTEVEVMRLEFEFNKTMEGEDQDEIQRLTEEKVHLQERVGLHDAYTLQRRAASRFSMLCHVFDVASGTDTVEEAFEQLCRLLIRSADGESSLPQEQQDCLRTLADALVRYFADGHTDKSDEAIREAWQNAEEMLRAMGRKI